MGFLMKRMRENRRRKDENKALSKLCRKLAMDFDVWIAAFKDKGVPPTESQATELEDDKITELIAEYSDKAAKKLGRDSTGSDDLIAQKKAGLKLLLESRKGRLYQQFSDDVAALEAQAAAQLKSCLDALGRKEDEMEAILPVKESVIDEEFTELMDDLAVEIEARYPGGVSGLDNYDDALPDGIPSWSGFKDVVEEKKKDMTKANKKAIESEIDSITANSKEAIKEKINEAIKNVIEEIKLDLSDDIVPFLGEEDMGDLRKKLMDEAEKYGTARLE